MTTIALWMNGFFIGALGGYCLGKFAGRRSRRPL